MDDPLITKKDSLSLAEKRLQAQIAMEGEERRNAREEIIRKEREAAEKIRQEEELKKKQQFEKEKIEKEQIEQAARIQQQREQISKQLKQQVEEVRDNSIGLKTIRTLKFDQDNLIKTQNISLVGIAIKEEERRKQRQENSSLSSGKNLKILLASLVLILISLGVGSYVYYFYYAASIPAGILPGKGVAAQSMLFTETYRTVDTSSVTTDDLINKIIKNEIRNPPDLRLGAIENFAFTKKDEHGIGTPLNTEEFFKVINAPAPDSFIRTLDREYMYGILSSAENAAFIIVKTEAYDKGFAGLLEWESTTMTKDLYVVLTSQKPDLDLLTKKFEDLLIRNIDTRVLKDKDGIIRIVYGFLDSDKTIVVAGSRQAFIEVLNRFNTPRPLAQ
ncbi:MAG: hypothetical protein Q7S19_03890 [bacterium]|nr:hypothetical protein [bacterium]